MPESWYEEVGCGERLTQGDIILDCPLVGWDPGVSALPNAEQADLLEAMLEERTADVVVMTQACDLEQHKVANVILCAHFSLDDYYESWRDEMTRRKQNPTKKSWEDHCDDIGKGFVWNLSLLNAGCSGTLAVAHRVVDFTDISAVPRAFLEKILDDRHKPRLRLRPPYREHLSQAFARFFMRVGLPIPLTGLEAEVKRIFELPSAT
jgi:hypothetical protein